MKLTLMIITFILVSKVSAWGTSMDADMEPQMTDGSENADMEPQMTDGSENADMEPQMTDGSENADMEPQMTDRSENADMEPQMTDRSENAEGSNQMSNSNSQTLSENIKDTMANSSENNYKTSTKESRISSEDKDDKTPTSSVSADDHASNSTINADDSSPKEPESKESITHTSSEGYKDSSSLKEPGSKESVIQMPSEGEDHYSSKKSESNEEGKIHEGSGSEGHFSLNLTGSKGSKTHNSPEGKDSASLTEPGSNESKTDNASGGKSHSSLKTTGSMEVKTDKSSEDQDSASLTEPGSKESNTQESSGSKSHTTPKTSLNCEIDGTTYQPGTFADPYDPCSICTCFNDGTYKCEEKICKTPNCGIGTFTDPYDPCIICKCFNDGTYECAKKQCDTPKCGTGIQKQYDGCCLECPHRCKLEKCETLTCAVENQFYRNDSCCAECGCECYGTLFQPGTFADPYDPCTICKCFKDGNYECAKKQCETPKCGTGIQKKYGGCCLECPPKCKTETCEKLTCPVESQFYRDDSCCAECGCECYGTLFQPGPFADPYDPCNICTCFNDGNYNCEKKQCDVPKCGTGIQMKYDGCCWECPPKCKSETCEKLTCAVENQFYRDDSCCAECGCECYGTIFQPGTFADPYDPCNNCTCFSDGNYKCEKKQCEAPKCGTGIQVQYDGCCWECPPECKPEICEKLTCAVENQFYRDDSCCAECGCECYGTLFQPGTFADPYDPCNNCTCFSDGNYKCEKKQCEAPKCGTGIHVQYDGCCWECPPKCQPEICEKLICAVKNQFYRDDSCCAECGCECYGTLFQPGTFADPYDPCNNCTCFSDGNYKCEKKQCEAPKCGTGIQVQYDGCCWECPPKCQPEICEKLACAIENQFYRDDSCCAECGCECYGTLFQPGTFADPYDPCNNCTCFSDGNYKCEKKQCEAPKCGTGIQVQYDGCCWECPPKCQPEICEKLTCAIENQFYRDDSCCAECGCECYGTLFQPGTFADPYDPCNNCTCFSDGNYKCEKKQCEAPKCGTGIQVQYDGCCWECPPKCQPEICEKLTCAIENQFYRDDSCCAECGCECYGTLFQPGTFAGPYDPCNNCTCFSDGNYKCEKKQCEAPTCGTGIQVQYDGCCWECPPKCKSETCDKLTCPVEEQFYRDDSCCAECGCSYNGTLVKPGPVGNPCEKCVCKNGAVICEGRKCPRQKLTCVDAEYDKNCTLICPRGKTCKKGEEVIKYGEFKTIENQLCTCVGQWCPYAFCAPVRVPKDIENLQKTGCVAKKFLN